MEYSICCVVSVR